MKALAGTGHRPEKLGGYSTRPTNMELWVKAKISDTLYENTPEIVISGMALGFDQWLAETALLHKIPFIAAIPFKGQESMWPHASKQAYTKLLEKAAMIIEVCQPGYAAWKMQERNKWMVDHASAVLACFDGSAGGTANCVQYAKTTKKQILLIDPNEFKIGALG